jgi:hypothetical protein
MVAAWEAEIMKARKEVALARIHLEWVAATLIHLQMIYREESSQTKVFSLSRLPEDEIKAVLQSVGCQTQNES